MLDVLIVSVLSAVPVAVAYVLALPTRYEGFSLITALGMLAAYIIPFAYYTVMPASTHQATYGKKVMGLRLVTVQGQRLSKLQAFLRVLLMTLLPITWLIAITLSFGGMAMGYKENLAASLGIAWLIGIPIILFGPYITLFFNPLRQTLYDLIAKTVVVNTRVQISESRWRVRPW